jgi:Fe-S-cluster containining protein
MLECQLSVESLCLRCALCCDGTLFSRVPLQASDTVPPALVVSTSRGGGRYLPQPCSGLDGRRCSVYLERPFVCRAYRCLLVTAISAGESTLAEALEVVERAHELVGEKAAPLSAKAKDFLRFHFGRGPSRFAEQFTPDSK